ncbi:MAG: hypothetical protein FJ395_09185 [Verrucomicrobia bacterium]|nr:hypothetical protein [Verrucomicrobiota bacterium]
MKLLFKLIKWLLLLVIVLGVALYFTRNIVARHAVQVATTQLTGFPLEIGSVDLGLLNGTLEVRDLKLTNPPEFHGGTFLIMPLLRVDYDTMSFVRRAPHIKELTVNVAEVNLVTNAKGETNYSVLQNRASSVGGGGAPKEEKKVTPYRVDLLKVHVGTVFKCTLGTDGKEKSKTQVLFKPLNAKYENITECTSISKLVMDTLFTQVGTVAGEVIKGAGEAVKGATDTLQKTTKGLFDAFKKK